MKFVFAILHLFAILVINNVKEANSSPELSGFCGDPGRPMRSQITPQQTIYSEGDSVVYKCEDYISIKQFRKCVNGKWIGKNAVCGNSFRNNDLILAQIIDTESGKIIQEYNTANNLTQSANFGNSFIAERYGVPLRLTGSKRYTIKLTLQTKGVLQLVRFSLSMVNSLDDDQIRDATFNISAVRVSPYRRCSLSSASVVSPWLHNSTRFDYWYDCDSLGAQQFRQELANLSDSVIIDTVSDRPLDLDLATFIIAEPYTKDGNPYEPICGTPEVPVGLDSHVIHHQSKYSYACATGFRPLSKAGARHDLVCSTDMKWNGTLPECFPDNTCPKFEVHTKSLAKVYSYDRVYYHNSTLWFAIEGTKAHFRCKNDIHIFVGKETRVCGANGQWSEIPPNCYDPNGSALNMSTIILIVIIVIVLTFGLTAVTIFCFIRIRQNRKQSKSMRHTGLTENDYDNVTYDCDDGKEVYAGFYEMVGDRRYEKTANYQQKTIYDDCLDNYAKLESNRSVGPPLNESYMDMNKPSNSLSA